MNSPSVLCIGEAMVELSLDSEHANMAGLGYAGDTLNTAIYIHRSNPDIRVCFATKVGIDAISERMVDFIRNEGIDTSHISRSATRVPGIYSIATDDAGERSFTYWRELSAARTLLQTPGLTREVLDEFSLVYLSGITLAILTAADRHMLLEWLAAYRAQGGKVAFDSNYRPALWRDQTEAQHMVTAALQVTDIALSGIEDEKALFGDRNDAETIARIKGAGVTAGALKRGRLGPAGFDGGRIASEPAKHIVDSTAAGDSFNAGFLAETLVGGTEKEALEAGHALANRVLQHRGAITPKDAA